MGQADLKQLGDQVAALIGPMAGEATAEETGRILEAAQASNPDDVARVALAWAGRRAEGAPLGLVIGRQRFMGLDLMAGADVLAPREETEILAREVLSVLRAESAGDPNAAMRMIDMGCGSGNLACAAATALPGLRVWASDITSSCADLTRANAARLGLQDRIQVSQGDLFAPLVGQDLEGTMDLVVMNPPYIPSTSLEKSHAGLLRHEPREAFDGGPYGISILTRLLDGAPDFLKPGGSLLFEFGLGQARIVQSLVDRRKVFSGCRFVADGHGEPRTAVLSR